MALTSLLLVAHLVADTAGEWYETRPFAHIDPTPSQIQNHFLLGAPRHAPSHIAVPPLVRTRRDETAACAFVHVGRGLCGHEGIARGGLLASLLDEARARTALLNLPSNIGPVTARLELSAPRGPLRCARIALPRCEGTDGPVRPLRAHDLEV